MATRTGLAIDKTVTLDVNGSTQRIRLCAERAGLPPLLIVQAGPGWPVLNEVTKFQRRLHLEKDFLVVFWEQRGCGPASRDDATSVSLPQQVADLRAVLRWLHDETKCPVIVFGISLGGSISLRAAEHEPDRVKSVVAISPDSQTAWSDASADAFLQKQSAGNRRLIRRVAKLAKPPYVDPALLQRRASLLADLGAIERGKTFNALLREAVFGMLRTYGVLGTVKTLRNMNLVQRTMLPELISLDLFANPPRLAVPVHYLFGEQDALTPAAVVKDLPAAVAAPASTVLLVPDAGHMVHFDQPDVVRKTTVDAAVSIPRVARLDRSVGQPDHILANTIIGQ
jgi:pimeloyl-ACP methyl ester carboxylesterase